MVTNMPKDDMKIVGNVHPFEICLNVKIGLFANSSEKWQVHFAGAINNIADDIHISHMFFNEKNFSIVLSLKIQYISNSVLNFDIA